ncbi:MAG TPA: redoxin family protein, partial [Gemmataceae bacterium]|nr:redoxin family protein [Gemmataceae bacterium]
MTIRRLMLPVLAFAIACLWTGAPAVHGGEKKKKEAGKEESLFKKFDKLTEDDAKDTKMKRSHAKTFKVKLAEGKAYKIDLVSDDFDTFLRLENSAGKEVAFNDDIDLANKDLNSRIIYVAPKTGEYKIIVTTFEGNKTGKFAVEMTYASAAEAKDAVFLARVDNFADSTPAEQRKLFAEVTKKLEAKGENLNINDAQIAVKLFMTADDSNAKFVREMGNGFVKIFGNASDKQVATVVPFLERSMKSLDKIGTPIEVTGMLTSGKEFDLAKLKGKVVLVDFWATWCGPCIAELPNVEAAYKKYHSKGFEVIGISLDREGQDKKLENFLKDRKTPWGCINIEDSRKLADRYEVNSIPYPVLVGADGRIVSLRARGP